MTFKTLIFALICYVSLSSQPTWLFCHASPSASITAEVGADDASTPEASIDLNPPSPPNSNPSEPPAVELVEQSESKSNGFVAFLQKIYKWIQQFFANIWDFFKKSYEHFLQIRNEKNFKISFAGIPQYRQIQDGHQKTLIGAFQPVVPDTIVKHPGFPIIIGDEIGKLFKGRYEAKLKVTFRTNDDACRVVLKGRSGVMDVSSTSTSSDAFEDVEAESVDMKDVTPSVTGDGPSWAASKLETLLRSPPHLQSVYMFALIASSKPKYDEWILVLDQTTGRMNDAEKNAQLKKADDNSQAEVHSKPSAGKKCVYKNLAMKLSTKKQITNEK